MIWYNMIWYMMRDNVVLWYDMLSYVMTYEVMSFDVPVIIYVMLKWYLYGMIYDEW